MYSKIVKCLLAATLGALALSAGAQTPAPMGKPSMAANMKMSEADIKAYKEGRKACSAMTGAAAQECRTKLAAKYLDKQCKDLTGDKLAECLKNEYPGE